MKKNFTLLALIMMALAVTFVSCTDDDEYEAYTLEGAWEGNMGVVISDGLYEYESTYSTIYFNKNPYEYASGEGYQVDYFNESFPLRHNNSYYLANHIRWTVYSGVIRIYYFGDDLYAEIRDYSLTNGFFEGVIDFENNTSSRFKLRKVYSPSYSYEWGWGDYFSKKGVFDEDGTRAAANATSGKKLVRTAAVKQ